MSLEITKEKVLEASKQSDEVKQVLETLFPDAFKPQNIEISTFEMSTSGLNMIFIGNDLAPKDLKRKCFILNKNYNWELIKGYADYLVLVPTKEVR